MSDAILARLAAVEARLAALESKPASTSAPAPTERLVADDADLDSEYGDPVVRFGLKPKYWAEQPDPNIGYKFSECTPEYLDATAKYLSACAYMKRKEGDEKKAGYKDRDAARARGWAKRIRANGGRPAQRSQQDADAEPEAEALPF